MSDASFELQLKTDVHKGHGTAFHAQIMFTSHWIIGFLFIPFLVKFIDYQLVYAWETYTLNCYYIEMFYSFAPCNLGKPN